MEEQKKVFAIISFVLSIVGVLANCLGLGLLFGIAAIILGIVSIKKKEALKGLAIAGIVIGALVTFSGIVAVIVALLTGASVGIPMIAGIIAGFAS